MNIIKTARGGITTRHGEEAGRSRPHVGIDIGHGNETADDLRMVAPAAGRVVAASWDGTYGRRVIIEHPDGTRSLVAHMASLAVDVGDHVEQGQTIGVMGRTGGPWGSVAGWYVHGHQEYHVGGIAVDPLAYMGGGSAQTGTPNQEEEMNKDQQTTLDNMAWQVDQIKARMDELADAKGKGSVHAKLDKLLWATGDPKAGLRKLVGDLTELVARIATKLGA